MRSARSVFEGYCSIVSSMLYCKPVVCFMIDSHFMKHPLSGKSVMRRPRRHSNFSVVSP